jgi:hypothetical protein
LHDVPAVPPRRFDHQLERGVNDRAGLFRVEVLHQFHRALDVGKQCRHRLALAVKRASAIIGPRREMDFGLRLWRFPCPRALMGRSEHSTAVFAELRQ